MMLYYHVVCCYGNCKWMEGGIEFTCWNITPWWICSSTEFHVFHSLNFFLLAFKGALCRI